MHRGLSSGSWQKLSLAEQLGNIGSEVGRAIKAATKDRQKLAAHRALELFDLTLADRRWRHRGTELARAREVTADFLLGGNNYKTSGPELEKYFMAFALAARQNR